eukprot:3155784-Pleurochrysis_carterae.AAC.1
MHAISAVGALMVTLGCAFAAALAFSPPVGFLSNWLCSTRRAQANSARRKSVRGASATDDRR